MKARIASFDVDAQVGFTPLAPQELPVPGGDEIVDELNAQARFADYRVGSKDWHSRFAIWEANEHNPIFSVVGAENVDIRWPRHCIAGTKGATLLPGLPAPQEYDFFVYKGMELDMHPYGACYHDLAGHLSTGVIEWLESKNVNVIVVGGLALDYCVKTTALQLWNRGFDVIVNLAATRAVDEKTGLAAIYELSNRGIVFVDNADQLDTALAQYINQI